MGLRLNEFLKLLEQERIKSGEDNPFVNVGTQDNKGTTYGGFEISNKESLGDRMRNEIFITLNPQNFIVI